MVVGLLGNKSPDSNRLTLVTPKSENDVRLQAKLGNQNPTGLPVGIVSAYPENCQSCGQCYINCPSGSLTIADDMYGYAITSYRAASTVDMNQKTIQDKE